MPGSYTTRVIGGTVPSGGSTDYVVPVGKRAVLRDVHSWGVAGQSLYIYVSNVGTIGHIVLDQLGVADWHGRAVAYAGETISLYGPSADVTATATAYLFDD